MVQSHLTIKQRVIISITPCNRPMCQHAVCKAYRAWVQWREAQFEDNQPMTQEQIKEFLVGINL